MFGYTALHPYSSQVSKTKTTCESHYYSPNKEPLFEKSLDIYKPACGDGGLESSTTNHNNLPLVVLVVGSAWVGHRSFIYAGTSWWNSSGPQTVARLGYTCICIRHRGAFPRLPRNYSINNKNAVYIFVILMISLTCILMMTTTLALKGVGGGGGIIQYAMWSAVMILALTPFLLEWGGQGCATLEDMLHDTAEALEWIQQEYRPGGEGTTKEQQQQQPPIIFGGYSSGAHVAATLLQRPDVWKEHNLPHPETFCQSVLFLSGVLSTRFHPKAHGSTPPPPQWLTNLLVHSIWDRHYNCDDENDDIDDDENDARLKLLPSPLHNIEKTPNIPHLLIGCRYEMPFRLPWLDIFFTSETYAAELQQQRHRRRNNNNIPVKYIAIDSDHWSMLNSNALSAALAEHLPTLLKEQQQQQRGGTRTSMRLEKSSSHVSTDSSAASSSVRSNASTTTMEEILGTSATPKQ